ncbi:MAG: hypothetical protein KIS85_02905 [Anaerolineales bacterium]|nr:hypothetical protein [Anaerolineales bacterium]
MSNPKELQDLQAEAEALGRQLSTLEDTELDKLAASEERAAALQTAIAELEAVTAQRGAESQSLGKEADRAEEEIARLEADRELALKGVEAEPLALYTQLRGTKAGLAVAKVAGGSCGACGAELSAALARRQPLRPAD